MDSDGELDASFVKFRHEFGSQKGRVSISADELNPVEIMGVDIINLCEQGSDHTILLGMIYTNRLLDDFIMSMSEPGGTVESI